MTYLEELEDRKAREEIFFIRAVCFIGGLVYPLWSIIYQLILEGVDDPISRRLQITALALTSSYH